MAANRMSPEVVSSFAPCSLFSPVSCMSPLVVPARRLPVTFSMPTLPLMLWASIVAFGADQVTALHIAGGVLGKHHLDADAGSGFLDRESFGVPAERTADVDFVAVPC